MKKTLLAFFFFLALVKIATAQPLLEEWKGEVTQTGKPGTFIYTLHLTRVNEQVSGTATSSNADGSGAAKFEVGGIFDGKLLVLQEVRQLEPPNARWCLKHMRLQLVENEGVATLEGNWEAEGCKPGTMKLVRQLAVGSQQSAADNSSLIPHPSSLSGRFSGHLSQSDRDYGFYFDMELEADGTGTSHIVSDGEGGNATHRLRWTFDEATGKLHFEESDLLEESVPTWRWCIKSGELFFKKEENRLSLAGVWEGYIEGFTLQTGACASGTLYVEQPVFQKEELVVKKPGETAPAKPVGVGVYEEKQKRDVEVERVLEVRSKTVRIRVWDSGTVDGDVLSLFLNGELIVKNYRVTRQKHETIVQLDKPTNFLILHALNVGSISPNTIAVSVDDGYQEQVVIISSNLRTSGAVMIREFTVK
ncbi:MAG: hypothetical protein HY842_08780 [Bacteroidetes bacterium]|nr:hypothetical protein [Bacteroidota bacterium]